MHIVNQFLHNILLTGYDGYSGLLDDQGYLAGSDGLETQYPAIQADNGSLIYLMPGYQPGLHPYAPYVPVATIGVDGQYITNPMLQSHIASAGYFSTSAPFGSELIPASYLYDPSLFGGDGGQPDDRNKTSDTLPLKSAQSQATVLPFSNFHSTSDFGKLSAFQREHTLQSDDVLAGGYVPIAKESSHHQVKS